MIFNYSYNLYHLHILFGSTSKSNIPRSKMHIVDEVQVGDASNEEAPIYGDVLETILSHVPLINLVPAFLVSKSWNRAVISSLNNFNKPKPWLIVHTQSTRDPYSTSTHAYDPRSHVWIEISQPSIQSTSALRSSCSNFIYMLSPSKFSFSHDPLRLTWHHVDAPHVWHVDPIVALLKDTIIIAGGTCEYEDDPLAVEMYDIKTQRWRTCEPMPPILKDSAASMWLSATVANNKLFLMEKSSGVTHWFDPKTQSWSEPFNLFPHRRIFYSVIGSSNDRLIMIGLIGTVENVEAVKISKLNVDENLHCEEEIGEMPLELIEKLRCETFGISTLNVCMAGDLVYVYNAAAAVEEVVVGEMVDGGGAWRWWSVKNEAVSDWSRNQISERTVFTCAAIGIDELRRVMSGVNRRFAVKVSELTRSS